MTSTNPKVYLAGPMVFYPDALDRFEALKALCRKYGLDGVSPFDNCPDLVKFSPQEQAQVIHKNNVELLNASAAILADVSPFRGATEPDSGTCVEIGRGLQAGKPVAGYLQNPDICHRSRCAKAYGETVTSSGLIDNTYGMTVENFGLPVNLMIGVPVPLFASSEEAIEFLASNLASKLA